MGVQHGYAGRFSQSKLFFSRNGLESILVDNIIALLVIVFAIIWGLILSVFFGVFLLISWDYCVSKQKTIRNRKK